jgi:sarcosine oxidase
MSVIYDVAVIGLGGHGSAIAAHLSERGSKVLGIDKYQRLHTNGSSHGHSRIIRLAYYEDQRYVPLLQRSLQLWKTLNSRNNNKDNGDLLKMTGGLMIGLPDSEVIRGTLESVKNHKLRHEVLNSNEIKVRFPAFHLSPDEIGVYESDAGYLVPEACVSAHLDMAIDNGADLRFSESVTSWSQLLRPTEAAGGEVFEVITSRTDKNHDIIISSYLTMKIVLAVGPWAPEFFGDQIPMKLHVERRVLYWFKPVQNETIFKDLPVYIWENKEGVSFYGFPTQKGLPGGVKVAMHFTTSVIPEEVNPEGRKEIITPETVFKIKAKGTDLTCTPDTIDRVVSLNEIKEMKSLLAGHMPDLNGDLVASETCMYTMTEDHHFLIDFHPAHDSNVVLVSPCSGHGFKFCAVIGEIVSDLILDGKSRHDISLFRLGRE